MPRPPSTSALVPMSAASRAPPSQRHPRPAAVDQGRRCRAAHPQPPGGLVLPGAAGTPTADRPGPVGGRDEADVHGTSTRKVDDLVKALGVEAGISKSEVSRICADSTPSRRVPVPLAGHTSFPMCSWTPHQLPVPVPGRHLPQGTGGWAGRLPRGRDRHRRDRRRRPGSAGPRSLTGNWVRFGVGSTALA